MRLAIIFVALSGCAVVDHNIDPALTPVMNATMDTQRVSTNAPLIQSDQPDPYKEIILQSYTEFEYEFKGNLSELSVLRLRARQGQLPQITPSVSARSNRGLRADLGVRQVLFSGRLYEAEFQNIDAQVISRQVTLLNALNTAASQDIGSYLEYYENTDREVVLYELADEIKRLLDLARLRSEGGLVTADEVALFELNLAEIQTDIAIARSGAQIALTDLPEIDVTTRPKHFFRNDDQLPIPVLVALTERELAKSDLSLARIGAEPQILLEGTGGIDLLGGSPIGNAGIVVESAPIAIGGNTDIQLAELKLRLAERNLLETVDDLEKETVRLEMQIEALEQQLAASSRLIEQANVRLDSFTNQFLAGSANLPEAIGLIDTLRRSIDTRISTEYEILHLRRQLAQELGHFWSL